MAMFTLTRKKFSSENIGKFEPLPPRQEQRKEAMNADKRRIYKRRWIARWRRKHPILARRRSREDWETRKLKRYLNVASDV